MQSPGELAAKKLAWEIESRKSVEALVRTTLKPGPENPPHSTYDSIEEHFIELDGKRFCDNRFFTAGGVVGRDTHFWDGNQSADVTYMPDLRRQLYVTISRQYHKENAGDRMERPHPFLLLYVGRTPLHKALAKATYCGTGEAMGRKCELFLFPAVKWAMPQDHLYYLDRETSIPLKVESYRDQAARDQNQPLWVWTAESIEKVQGHNLTPKSRLVRYNEQKPAFEWSFSLESITFDKDHEAATFWPAFEPGVEVHDMILDKHYVTPGARAPEQTSTAAPIEAVPPGDWMDTLPWASLILGCAILITGGCLWWKRR